MVTHIEIVEEAYTSLEGFGGLGHKTTGKRFLGLCLKTQLEFGMDLGAACGIITKLASRQSKVMKGSWSSYAPIKRWTVLPPGWTILPLRLSGLAKYLRASMGIV